MYYSETVTPRFIEYTGSGKLGYEAMLHITETVGSHHSQSVNDSLKHGHIAWMIVDLRVKILRRPKDGEDLCVRTWSRGKAEAAATFRDFDVTSESGERLFIENCKFALVDTRVMKMTKLSDELIESYKPENETVFEEDAPKLSAPEDYEFEMPVFIRKTDIDFNDHVHNTKYLDYALEALPYDEFKKDDFTYFRIVFRAGLKYGQNAVIRRTKTENGYTFAIVEGDKLYTLIELER